MNTGLQRPKQEAHDLLQQAVARCPGYRRAYHAYLHRLGKRWGGEDLEAVTFALTVHSQAPEGSPLHALVPRVLVESVIDERLNDYSLLRTNLGAVQAMQSAWPRGLGSPRYQEDIYTLNDRNKFAFVLYACGLDREARVEFDKIGSRKTPYPWGMLGDPNAFEVVRKVVYR